MSRKFTFKGVEHDYNDTDQIFFIREATSSRH